MGSGYLSLDRVEYEDEIGGRMPMLQKDVKPPRMHGITPTPLEIPPELLPEHKPPKSKRPLLISVVAMYIFIWAGIYLLLALVRWGNPQSELASYMLAHRELIFHLLPVFFLVYPHQSDGSQAVFIQILPYMFLLMGLVSSFVAWKLWNLDSFWFFFIRCVLILESGQTALGLMIYMHSVRHPGAALQSLPVLAFPVLVQIPFFVYLFWNLWLFFYMSFDPKVNEFCQNNK